jgi:hypothetical protein
MRSKSKKYGGNCEGAFPRHGLDLAGAFRAFADALNAPPEESKSVKELYPDRYLSGRLTKGKK